MSSIDVEIISTKIKKMANEKKMKDENLLNFIAVELAKSGTNDVEKILDSIIDDIKINYLTQVEIRTKLREKLEEKKHDLGTLETISRQITSLSKAASATILSSNSSQSLTQLFNRLDKSQDLTSLLDTALHFGNSHMKLARRLFFLQITQNYLSALKYFITNDLVTRQTTFNKATEDSLKEITRIILELKREIEISLTELKNYKKTSEWIQNNEHLIVHLEEKLKILDGETIRNNEIVHKIEIKTVENYNELKEMIITKDLKTTEFLLEKISKLEDKINNMKKPSDK